MNLADGLALEGRMSRAESLANGLGDGSRAVNT